MTGRGKGGKGLEKEAQSVTEKFSVITSKVLPSLLSEDQPEE